MPSMAIGEIDQTIFECPSCSRPLALGVRRCPGCRARLVRGVTLGKASGFAAMGLAVGLLVGVGGSAAFGLTRAGNHGSSAAPAASSGPLSSVAAGSSPMPAASRALTASTRPTSVATDPAGIPPLASTALVQVVGTNGRLTAGGADLRAALAARVFDASEVAQVLRTISAESVFSVQVAQHVANWSGSADIGAQLTAFYDSVHVTAANGLVASVRNDAAYRAAANAMLKLFDGMPALDAAVRSTAAAAGVALPPASTLAP